MMRRGPSQRFAAAGKIPAAAFLSVIFIAGVLVPARLPASPAEDVTVVLRDKVIRDLSSAGLTLAFQMALGNRTSTDRSLVRYRYRFTVAQKEFLNMSVDLEAPLTVPAGREIVISLPVKITYALLFAAVGPIEEKATCDVVGDFFFADARGRQQKVPFAFPGEFPIFKDPVVELLPLKVNDLTVGGADVVFRARFRNPNGYELLIDRIGYRLSFGGKEVQSGALPGEKNIPASGERAFEIPFLMDFFESGKDLRETLQKPAFPCRFEGEIEIASAWGRLLVRFDKTQDLAAEKSS